MTSFRFIIFSTKNRRNSCGRNTWCSAIQVRDFGQCNRTNDCMIDWWLRDVGIASFAGLSFAALSWSQATRKRNFLAAIIIGVEPSYLMETCQPVSNVSGRSCLRCSARSDLAVLRTKTSTYEPHRFAVSRPTSWNSLPQSFRDATPELGQFQRSLKTSLFRLPTDVIWLRTRDCPVS